MSDVKELGSSPESASGSRAFGGTTFVAGVIVGTFVGACIALLVAPNRGAVSRRRLGRRAREWFERAGEGLREEMGNASDRARRRLLRRRRRWRARLDRLAADAGESYADPM